ncbi:MAG TPA: MlaD family protein [Steroidobacteraceae bacterium]
MTSSEHSEPQPPRQPPRQPPPPPRRTVAGIRKSWWPGWIWAVPIAAVGIVIWLLLRAFSNRGTEVTVTFDDAAQMKARDTKVLYRGLEVGQVNHLQLTKDRKHVVARLNLHHSVEKDLTVGTRFYLQGAQPSFSDPSSLKAILAGPSILMVPGAGAATRHFVGIAGAPPPTFTMRVPYVVLFDGDVGKLKAGAPVTLRGFTVGEVASVSLITDARSGKIVTPVVLDLDPTRFHVRDGGTPGSTPAANSPAAAANSEAPAPALFTKLVQQGLRASLAQDPPLIGAQEVQLLISPDAQGGSALVAGNYPQITAQNAGGIAQLAQKLGQFPIAQIGDNVREITAHLNALVSSPQLKDSIAHIDQTFAQVDKMMRTAGPEVAPTIRSVHQTVDALRRAATQIDATADAARKMMGGSGASPNGNLQQAVGEMTDAARSVRTLANYLDQHPEALVRGR